MGKSRTEIRNDTDDALQVRSGVGMDFSTLVAFSSSRNDKHTITLGRKPTTREKYQILRVSSPDDNVIISAKQCCQLRLVKIIEKPNCPAGVRKLTMITERHDEASAAPDAPATSDVQAARDAPTAPDAPVSPETLGNVEDSPTLSGIQIEN